MWKALSDDDKIPYQTLADNHLLPPPPTTQWSFII
jgi:hypothetical protein